MSDRTGFHIVWHTGRRSRGEINFPRHASVSKKWFTSLSSCVRVTSTTMSRIHLSGWKGSRGPPFTPEDNNYPRLIYTSRRAARKRNEKICMRAYIYIYICFFLQNRTTASALEWSTSPSSLTMINAANCILYIWESIKLGFKIDLIVRESWSSIYLDGESTIRSIRTIRMTLNPEHGSKVSSHNLSSSEYTIITRRYEARSSLKSH